MVDVLSCALFGIEIVELEGGKRHTCLWRSWVKLVSARSLVSPFYFYRYSWLYIPLTLKLRLRTSSSSTASLGRTAGRN